MTGAPPKVTAIVSTYSAERFMRGCLEDLVAQTIFPQIEVIVVDAASPQNERNIVAEFQQRHPNIRYLRTDQREPLYAAWNRAIRLARGEYLTNANTDDRHAPHALETLARALNAHPEAGVAYASMAITDQENGTLGTALIRGRFKARKFDRRRLFHDCMPGPQPMWRRELHDRFGFFDETFVTAGDYEFWLRISAETKFLHIPEVLGLFLQSPQSISNSDAERNFRESEAARDRHWPAAWGPRPAEHRTLLDRLTRRSTYRKLFQRIKGSGSSCGTTPK
jgi:glycosyltransferase involved in cell wall biosynthesis